ncbi:hypothetical protein EMCRGX_G021649 [Ephydatia muelleri]
MSSESLSLASSDACAECTMSVNVETEDVRLTVHVDIRKHEELAIVSSCDGMTPLRGGAQHVLQTRGVEPENHTSIPAGPSPLSSNGKTSRITLLRIASERQDPRHK